MPQKTYLTPDEAEPFLKELRALRTEITAESDGSDAKHLKKVQWWSRLSTLFGYLTAWIVPNPVSAFFMSLGNVTRWTILAHHICHGAYDDVDGVTDNLKSRGFANGWRRFLDWPDWIDPTGWKEEHNRLHHYHTGELADPDLVERNLQLVRGWRIPVILKYAIIGFFMCTWKWTYYAPNTLWVRQLARKNRGKEPGERGPSAKEMLLHAPENGVFPGAKLFLPFNRDGVEFWKRCLLPYAIFRFGLLPLLFLPLGTWAWASVLINSLLAEVIANVHSFLIIVPNHCGDDVCRFEGSARDAADFSVRQIVGSVNYSTRGEFDDFLMGWLNYQIEHHLWPDLPPLKYRAAGPKVKALCEKYGLTYVEENVFARFRKMAHVAVGKTSMLRRAEVGAV